MAICKTCGIEQAGFMSELCGKCLAALPPGGSMPKVAQPAAGLATESPMSEGDYTSIIGKAIIWLSIAASGICLFVFGRVQVPAGLYGTETVWSTALVMSVIAAGIDGIFFGFLLTKVGSVLRHLEQQRKGD